MRGQMWGMRWAALVAALLGAIVAPGDVQAQRRGNGNAEAGGGRGQNNNNNGRRGERQGPRRGDDQAGARERNGDPEALRGQQRGGDPQRGGDQQRGAGEGAGQRGGGRLADVAHGRDAQRPAPERPVNEIASRIKDSPYAIRLAERLSETVQRDVNHLVGELSRGNGNPGMGTQAPGRGFLELRGNNSGRVIVRQTGEKSYDIVGKFEGHERGDAQNARTIERLIRDYEANR
jgi:hypothetical protein